MKPTLGGNARIRHGSRGCVDATMMKKTPVFGMVERGGKVMAFRDYPMIKSQTIFPIIASRILPESTFTADEYSIYDKLSLHANHTSTGASSTRKRCTSCGDVHTQTIVRLLEFGKAGNRRGLSLSSRKYCRPI